MAADYYDLLGVRRDATQDEIKRAYRRLARQLHPDANPDDPTAESRFKEVSRAYAVLSDPEARSRYDRFGPDGVSAGSDPFAGVNVSDIFEAFFGGGSPFGGGARRRRPSGPQRGEDLETRVNLTFEEAVFGCEKEVVMRTALRCEECSGTGSTSGRGPDSCQQCGGAGQVRQVRQSILGQVVTATTCPSCRGEGRVVRDPCPACGGDGRAVDDASYQVQVPAGVDHGATLRVSGKGAVGPRGGPTGDLFVRVAVSSHPRVQRDGIDLLDTLPISVAQACLGAELPYASLDGEEEVHVAPGTQPGTVLRLVGRGVPRLQGRGRGDLLLTVDVTVPDKLTADEESLLRQWAALRGDSVAPPAEGGLFSRIRSAFQ